MRNIITKFKSTKNKASWAMSGAIAAVFGYVLMPVTSLASGLGSYTSKVDAKGMTTGLIKQIGSLMTYVGAVVLAVGVIQVILAFKNEDADGKTRGMLVAVTGIALVAIDSILKAVVPDYN
jgi:uncharacterized membrane protein HdeD (DUF308 family)